MSEQAAPGDAAAWHRQLKMHLKGLQQAGVEWLPRKRSIAEVPQQPPGPRQPARGNQPAEVCAPLPSDSGENELARQKHELQVLAAEVGQCTRCAELASTRTQTVFGQGPPNVELCFIGEAPGADEDAQGLPFVGAAGQLLNRIIAACGLQREEVYICNILKCRPPGNRTPLPNEAANCRPFLERQLKLVGPKFICALGGCAAQNLLGTTVPIGKLRGHFHEFQGIPVLVTYHPAYLLPHRNPDKKKDVWEDMKMLLRKMGRPIPNK